ncbi:DUF7373 family lipoprotein [Nocardia xishanensis]
MMRRRYLVCASAFAVILATTACGKSDEGGPASRPTIDISKLDPGNYPTAPVDVAKTRVDDSAAAREAIRIGDSVPLAMEVDSRFIYEMSRYFSRIVTPNNPPYFDDTGVEGKDFDNVAPGLVAGWYTQGRRRAELGAGRGIEMIVVRFSTADQAAAAARALADRTKGESYTINGHPGGITKYSLDTGMGNAAMSSYLAHRDMLLYARINDPVSMPFDPAAQADLVKRVFDKQIEMLKGYSPTPLDKISQLPLDVDGMLSRTLPLDSKSSGASAVAVYPRHAALHPEHRPDLSKAAFEDAGVDYVSAAQTFVLRTHDTASADRLIAAFEAQLDMDNYKKIDGPPNLPNARCYNAKDGIDSPSDYPPICWVPNGRFVAEVGGRNVQDLHQRTAAQYILLSKS